jgi:hypothetical protein
MTVSLVTYSSCQAARHIDPSLRLLILSSLSVSPFLPFMGRECLEVASASTVLACKSLVVSSCIWVGTNSYTISSQSLSAAQWKTRLLASQPPVREFFRGPHVISPCFPDLAPVSCFILWSHCQVSCKVPCNHVPCAVQERHGGSTVHRQWPTSAGTHHHPGSISSSVGGTLQLGASLWISSPVLQQPPQWPR